MANAPIEEIVDRIYEAAVIPELWEDLLDRISSLIGARGGYIFTLSEERQGYIASAGVARVFEEFVQGPWPEINTRVARAEQMAHPGFITDLDVYQADEFPNEPIYRDFLYPRGMGCSVGSHIEVPNGDKVSVGFERGLAEGHIERSVVDQLDLMRPHFARALSLTVRLKQKLATAMADTLGSFGLPACVVNGRGQVKSANTLMHKLIPEVIEDRRERIVLRHRASDRLLEQALQGKGPAARGAVGSIPVPAIADAKGCVVHVLPICGQGRDVLAGSVFIVAVTQLSGMSLPGPALLKGLFDLTPSEVKIARSIARGVTTRDISSEMDISYNTVKVHLKSIFAKTGTTHQASLAHLLSGMRVPE